MPLRQFIGNDVVFQPHELAVMTVAFEEALRKLGLNDRTDKLIEIVASKVIDLAKRGERDPVKLRDELLKTFAEDGAKTGAFLNARSRGKPYPATVAGKPTIKTSLSISEHNNRRRGSGNEGD